MRVIVGDPVEARRGELAAMIIEWGYEPVLCSSGDEVWRLLIEDETPSIVMLSWALPGMSALEVCRGLRQADRPIYHYLLVMAHDLADEDLLLVLEAGADDFLRDPLTPLLLRARLKVGRRLMRLQNTLLERHAVLKREAEHDDLTGLLDRGAIDEYLERELERAVRLEEPLAVFMMDLDHFKAVNDSYGHHAGDAVLVESARRVLAELRPYDGAGRYGGEEFLVVLPRTHRAGAFGVAERVRKRISNELFESQGLKIPLTVTVGVSVFEPEQTLDGDALVRAADEALYRGKEQGRNVVVLAEAPVEQPINGVEPAQS